MNAATLGETLTQLADAADRGHAGAVPAILQACLASCAQAAGLPAVQRADVQQRLTVWRDVWPRLGQDPQFRAAVAREARRWATELQPQRR